MQPVELRVSGQCGIGHYTEASIPIYLGEVSHPDRCNKGDAKVRQETADKHKLSVCYGAGPSWRHGGCVPVHLGQICWLLSEKRSCDQQPGLPSLSA